MRDSVVRLRNWSCIATLLIAVTRDGCARVVAAEGATSPVTLPALITVKPNLPKKKIIETGWDQFYSPGPAYIRDNIREMEKRPFDGVIFCLDGKGGKDGKNGFGGGQVFDPQAWDALDATTRASQLKTLADIKWDKFTDNFVAVFTASNMDWFSDADWRKILSHAKFIAMAAKVARCKGVMLDPEPYGPNPWNYRNQLHARTKSFEDYSREVRQRGNEFMHALLSKMPQIRIFSLFQYAYMMNEAAFFGVNSPDPATRAAGMSNDRYYGLMPSFYDGMLEAADPGVQFIDGNESSYYYNRPLQYFQSYHTTRYAAKELVAPELRGKYDRLVSVAQPVYLDSVLQLRPEYSSANHPNERNRWLEHSFYYALQASDEYVWLWNENLNWYTAEGLPGKDQTPEVKSMILKALASAKGKVERREPLGFDIGDDMKALTSE